MKMKTLIRVLLALLLVFGSCAAAMAEITLENNVPVAPGAGQYSLTEGVYYVKGTVADPIVTNGQVTLHFSDAKIDMSAEDVPAVTVETGSLSLSLSGKSTVRGGEAMAGIYVAEGASLSISGTGELSAFGGEGYRDGRFIAGGGAGIGGNGIYYHRDEEKVYRNPGFGTVTIQEGTVNATGGNAVNNNGGAGAGIGSGGLGGVYGYESAVSFPLAGKVVINGGTVNAYGGEERIETAQTCGGAGIGCGGLGNGDATNCTNRIEICIYGGTIKAQGGVDGAGIGSGANSNSYKILITGGDIEAKGGYEVDDNGNMTGISGGAGIGGGDMSGITEIRIGGNAQVKAYGGGSAAGIGGGKDGNLYGKVFIEGSAKVWAYGGTAYHDTRKIYFGGAGIGAGAGRYNTYEDGEISISENAYVRAYAGKCAQAIGAGSRYNDCYCSIDSLKLSDNIDIWMFNQDHVQPAFWGQTNDGKDVDYPKEYSADGLITAWYTNPESEDAFPADKTRVVTSTYPQQQNIFWEKQGKEIQIFRADKLIANETAPFEPGNWGTLIKLSDPGQGVPGEPDLPQTGDDANLLLWLGLMAGACIVWVCCKRKTRSC